MALEHWDMQFNNMMIHYCNSYKYNTKVRSRGGSCILKENNGTVHFVLLCVIVLRKTLKKCCFFCKKERKKENNNGIYNVFCEVNKLTLSVDAVKLLYRRYCRISVVGLCTIILQYSVAKNILFSSFEIILLRGFCWFLMLVLHHTFSSVSLLFPPNVLTSNLHWFSCYLSFSFLDKGLFITKIKISGNIKYLKGYDIDYFRKTLASHLAIKETAVRYLANGEGSFILVFQLPNNVKSKLLSAAKNREQWLREANVSGLQIEGKRYISLIGTDEGKA